MYTTLMHRARPTKTVVLRVGRYASTKTRQNRRYSKNDDDDDFRPSWVYSSSRFLTYTAIPREAIPTYISYDAHSTSHAPLLRIPCRLGRARTHLYARELFARLSSSCQPTPLLVAQMGIKIQAIDSLPISRRSCACSGKQWTGVAPIVAKSRLGIILVRRD